MSDFLLICMTFSTSYMLQNFKSNLFCQNRLELWLNLCWDTRMRRNLNRSVDAARQKPDQSLKRVPLGGKGKWIYFKYCLIYQPTLS